MIEKKTPEISIDEIMERIREEVRIQKKRAATDPVSSPDTYYQSCVTPPLPSCTVLPKNQLESDVPALPDQQIYTLNDLIKYHDTDFINNAYKAILGRLPDFGGEEYYLKNLRDGRLSKSEILGRLKYFSEGRRRKISIKGLLFPFLIQSSFKIPILGKGLRIVTGILNLPTILKNLQISENTAFITFIKSKNVNDQMQIMYSQVQSTETALKEDAQNISRKVLNYRRTLLDQERRLRMFLNEARKRLPEPFTTEQLENLVSEEDHMHDAMYVAFEDQFRGTREDIKDRLKVYLPYVKKVMQQTGGGEILDVGCGRGEWLELMKEEGYKARGVDINRVMVAQSQETGLDVIASDVLDYLKGIPADSLAAVTGFQIIEHLPFNKLISLFDESLRVLKPGGVVIFETPNPENLIIGACNFYTDPTHKNPIPPHTSMFLIEQRGFVNVVIERLHTIEGLHLEDKFLNSQFTVGQDYTVIGYKL